MTLGDPVEPCGETEAVDEPTAVGISGLRLTKLRAVLLTVISEDEVVMSAGWEVVLALLLAVLVSLALCLELALDWTLDFFDGGGC